MAEGGKGGPSRLDSEIKHPKKEMAAAGRGKKAHKQESTADLTRDECTWLSRRLSSRGPIQPAVGKLNENQLEVLDVIEEAQREERDKQKLEEEEGVDQDVMAAMGFGGFGGGK